MHPLSEQPDDLREERLAARLAKAEKTVEELTVAVRTNRDIGAAVGIVMSQMLVTQQGAFDLLRQASQRLNVKLRDVAEDVIVSGVIPGLLERPTERPRPKPPLRLVQTVQQCLSMQGRVTSALHNADLRDVAASVRASASRARGRAAEARQKAATQREASGNIRSDPNDRHCEIEDRNAEAIDNIWTGRDGDAAASDRALLSEASSQAAPGK
jgi:uncharacterized coiled-coil protein SlyX